MWADIALKYPAAADELSKEIIFIDWNYGWQTNHFGDVGNLQQKGFTFWGSPALRSGPDNWYTTDWEKHFNNQRDFIPYARKAGYKGLVMTSWSTSGLYGFTRDRGNKILDMEQIRNVYPLAGFRILVAAYAESLQQEEALNPEKFVVKYANKRFGFNKSDGVKLWNALSVSQELIIEGKPKVSETINKMEQDAAIVSKLLYSLKPIKNKKEFEHFKLMIDVRQFYLAFSRLESTYNSPGFSIDKTAQLIPELKELVAKSKKLDKRFIELNTGFLYKAELENQNKIRNLALNNLYKRVIKLKN